MSEFLKMDYYDGNNNTYPHFQLVEKLFNLICINDENPLNKEKVKKLLALYQVFLNRKQYLKAHLLNSYIYQLWFYNNVLFSDIWGGTKKCKECSQVKELSEYTKKRTNRDGHDSRCKKCRARYNKKYYKSGSRSAEWINRVNKMKELGTFEEYKAKLKKRNKKRYLKNRNKILYNYHLNKTLKK